MPKNKVREFLHSARSSLTEVQAEQSGRQICAYLKAYLQQNHWLIFASIENEISTKPIFEFLKLHQRLVFFPAVSADSMKFYEVQDWKELKVTGKIPEPSKKSHGFQDPEGIVLVPGLGFHRSGHRIGYGKGFYDRFLAAHPNLFRLGIGYASQVISDLWPVDPHDEVLDAILTPSGLWGSKRL